MDETDIDVSIPPSGTGCAECLADGSWWVHLRRCAGCGHIGCATARPTSTRPATTMETGHRYVRSFEPGESWYWDYEGQAVLEGPELTPPQHRPTDQPVPGPAGAVPLDWRERINH